ncbi:MAG: hypothetical protein KF686_09175 [Ramlibacter sp.]|nr:hypothetical protein [Ramlibacter sp.]
MLVALAVTSMLVALLMGSLYYGTRVQAALADDLGAREKSLQRADWFAGSLRSCMPEEASTEARFIATESEIRCMTVAPLDAREIPSPQKILWALRKSSSDPRVTELTYQNLDVRGASPVLVYQFSAETVKFKFSGVDAGTVSSWPRSPDAPETLPRVIFLVVAQDGKESVAAAVPILADPWLEQERKNPFGMELPR